MDRVGELSDLSQTEKVKYLLSLRVGGETVIAICQQYGVAESTFYDWLSRYSTHETFENLSRAPRQTHPKVTQPVKEQVIEKHKHNPRLGCWRLSLFDYLAATHLVKIPIRAISITWAKNDKDFDNICKSPEFQQLINSVE